MLTVSNLVAGYGKVQVLHGISIEVPKGKVVTLIGSNGAGKTTTMRAVSGMIAPASGEITLNGERIDGMESYSIAKRGLAHSPEGRRVFATMSVSDNLRLGAFPRLSGSRPRGDVEGDLERAMELFPRLKERRAPARRHALGRRAADAGDGARDDAQSRRRAARRAVDGAGADPRQRGVQDHRAGSRNVA